MNKIIKVYYKGRLLKEIDRPVHDGPAGQEVVYKGKRYPFINGDAIEIAPESGPTSQSRATSVLGGAAAVQRSATDEEKRGGPEVVPRKDLPEAADWVASQRAIIDAPAHARLLIEAAPGTGKTAVACARVAHLLNEGINGDKIWLLSFTRTAVQEIRIRIKRLARRQDAAAAVRIATLDSTAWQLRQGSDTDRDSLMGSFLEGIEATTAKLQNSDEVICDYVAGIEHLVIDEAQDVVRERATLVLELIRKLDTQCGITVFCDSAQAIFGFDEEDPDAGSTHVDTVVDLLKREDWISCELRSMTDVIRTADKRLRSIFVDTRALLVSEHGTTYGEVRKSIAERAHGHVGRDLYENGLADREDALALYRYRAGVLLNGSFLASKGEPFRLRLSAFPQALVPWLGVVFGEWPRDQITRTHFEERFRELAGGSHARCIVSEAWTLLVRNAGISNDIVDLRRLRVVLAGSQPPIDFVAPELGVRGPILSTIHASKGREAEEVHLMLESLGDARSEKEEQRVLFVGATRARSKLQLGVATGSWSPKVPSGRRYAPRKGASVQFEVGRKDDFDELSIVSRAQYVSRVDALAAQEWLRVLGATPRTLHAWRAPLGIGRYQWLLKAADDNVVVGALRECISGDLFAVLDKLSLPGPHRPPSRISHIFALGTRTIVRPPNHPDLALVHEPWQRSGFWLAPVLFGFANVAFIKKQDRRTDE